MWATIARNVNNVPSRCNIMAPGTITALKNLDAMKDDYTVKVRIIRLWTRPTFRNPLSVYCYDMILMDEEVSNGYTGSKLFINADIEEISTFKNRFIEASISKSSTTQSGFTTSIFTSPEDEFLNKNQFFSIGEINITKETDGSGDFDEATFLECESPKCLNSVIPAVPKYKIPVRVQDCTGIVTLTLFDQVATKFLQFFANELLNNNEELSKDGVIPDEFNSLIKKKWMFKIYVGEFNLANNKDGYTISKVTDDPSIISELEKKFDLVQVTT
ncbi:hypothetical protein L1987_08224 [Smallanthus sonchifolius]|uniref:Uncharacterized protein n=1 Tax=Smallanthus sonchifolius TaxID=185202 RepID=A0ACB9JLS1_9ASTR|nr:hypothetical protein L1987_08224 [Smallanthus sonchifolius]